MLPDLKLPRGLRSAVLSKIYSYGVKSYTLEPASGPSATKATAELVLDLLKLCPAEEPNEDSTDLKTGYLLEWPEREMVLRGLLDVHYIETYSQKCPMDKVSCKLVGKIKSSIYSSCERGQMDDQAN